MFMVFHKTNLNREGAKDTKGALRKNIFGTDDADGHGYCLSFLENSGGRFLEPGCPPGAERRQIQNLKASLARIDF